MAVDGRGSRSSLGIRSETQELQGMLTEDVTARIDELVERVAKVRCLLDSKLMDKSVRQSFRWLALVERRPR